MNATLTRSLTGNSGTFGKLVLEDGTSWDSGELPWRDNRPQKSCIPLGTYHCEIYNSPKHGPVYQVLGVPDRDYIEIHSANFFGDKDKGLKCDMLGCIGLGKSTGFLDGQNALISSKIALAEFQAKQGNKPFTLTIR